MKISICIPTFNQAKFLADAVGSALAQDWPDLEVVVSNNHSTDDTEAILARFEDRRLRIVRPASFLGMFDHFNFCIQKTSGEAFTLLCSDDLLLHEHVRTHAWILSNNPAVTFSHGAVEVMDARGNTIRAEKSVHNSFIRSGRNELSRYVYGPRAVLASALIRRSSFNIVGGFSTLNFVGDWDLYIRLLQIGDVAYSDRVTAKFRSWLDPEGKRASRYMLHLAETVEFYGKFEPMLRDHFPEVTQHFPKARQKQALGFLNGFAGLNGTNFQQAQGLLKQLSWSWRVRLKLICVRNGLSGAWIFAVHTDRWIRPKIKALIYSLIKFFGTVQFGRNVQKQLPPSL